MVIKIYSHTLIFEITRFLRMILCIRWGWLSTISNITLSLFGSFSFSILSFNSSISRCKILFSASFCADCFSIVEKQKFSLTLKLATRCRLMSKILFLTMIFNKEIHLAESYPVNRPKDFEFPAIFPPLFRQEINGKISYGLPIFFTVTLFWYKETGAIIKKYIPRSVF